MFRRSTLQFFKKTVIHRDEINDKINYDLKYAYKQIYYDLVSGFKYGAYTAFFLGTIVYIRSTVEKKYLDVIKEAGFYETEHMFEISMLSIAMTTISSLIHILRFRTMPIRCFSWIAIPHLFFLGGEISMQILKFFVLNGEMLRDKYKKIDFGEKKKLDKTGNIRF